MSTIQRLLELDSAAIAASFNRCFEDYLVPIRFDAEEFERRFRAENLDPHASRLWRNEHGEPQAVLLIARRGRDSRVAAMAIAPGERGRGFGKRVLSLAIDEAIARGDRRLFLEVIESNGRARHLYEGSGFRSCGRLVGFLAPEVHGASGDRIEEHDAREVARLAASNRALDSLPWQLQAETLFGTAAFAKGYSVTHQDGRKEYAMVLGGRIVSAAADVRLLRALPWLGPMRAPAIFPETKYAAAFGQAGWSPAQVAQLEMVLDL